MKIKLPIEYKRLFHAARELGITSVTISDRKYGYLSRSLGELWLMNLEIYGIKVTPESEIQYDKKN